MLDLWQKYPFLRLAVPFLPGLWAGRMLFEGADDDWRWGATLAAATVVAGIGCVWAGIRLRRSSVAVPRLNPNVGFGLLVFLLFFFFGMWRSYEAWRDVARDVWPQQAQLYRAVVSSPPREGRRSVGAEAVLAGDKRAARWGGRKVWLTLPKDSLSLSLRTGDGLLFSAWMRRPSNRGNPEEFDYAEYLAVRGISAQAFVGEGEWQPLSGRETAAGDVPGWTALRVRALALRDKLVGMYHGAGLQGEDLAFFAALTLGDQSGLSNELKEVYSGVGVSHVLALSGMHLTYLVAMLNLLLLRFFRRRWLRVLGVLFVWGVIWGYTFLAGLPPSLVRATIMYTLMLAGSLLGRSGFSLNSLALSAVLMLCANPLLCYDAGFQLSFLAMCGILLVCPRYQDMAVMRVPYVRWVAQSLLVSFAAQLFTIPLVACRFGTFAPYSALATLWVSPVTAVLVCAMPLLLLSVGTGLWPSAVGQVVSWLEAFQNQSLRVMMEWPGAVVQADWTVGFTLLCYALLCLWVVRPFHSKAARWKAALAGAVILLCGFFVSREASRVRPCVVFYNNPSCPAVHVVCSPSRSYLFALQADSVHERLAYAASRFWEKKLSASPFVVAGDYRDDAVVARQGLVSVRDGVTFLQLCDGRWAGVEGRRADVDYLHVCRGFRGSLAQLSRLFRPRCVVLDASLRGWQRRSYAQECEALGWPVHDMYSQGALKVDLR